ncbi:MAG: 3-hydroxyacyl-CoA dehydrogenase family protein [Bryobacterales bacterium]
MPVGVVGMGLMGTSIATCLLAAGHPVAGIDVSKKQLGGARRKIGLMLRQMKREGLLKSDPAKTIQRLTLSVDYASLRESVLVIESTAEDIRIKKEVFRKIEAIVSPAAIIGSNTSAIPISLFQKDAVHPGRYVAIHWSEPAHVSRFLEVACGEQTRPAVARRVIELAANWDKEPALLRRDVRGFISNRCAYALYREAFHIVEQGWATMEDVDRSLRNDIGWWIPFAGPFRYMDLTGGAAYGVVMKDLWPELSRGTEVPEAMKKLMAAGGKGVANANGFYRYTREEAERWERQYREFNYDIRRVARKYPSEGGRKRRMAGAKSSG